MILSRRSPLCLPWGLAEITMGKQPSFCSTTYTLPYSLFLFLDLFRRVLLESPLSWENYSEKFHLLLYLEEQQMEVDIKRYNIPNDDRAEATMTRDRDNKKLLVLEVSICLNYQKAQDKCRPICFWLFWLTTQHIHLPGPWCVRESPLGAARGFVVGLSSWWKKN